MNNGNVRICVTLLVCATLLACSPITLSQDAQEQEHATKEKPGKPGGTPARWEGIVERSNPEKLTLNVRKRGTGNFIKTIHYDSSTKWESQYHGSKKVNDIDASQVKDGDRVICIGIYDEKGEFRAMLISKRLSN
jgi:hypothetical protein